MYSSHPTSSLQSDPSYVLLLLRMLHSSSGGQLPVLAAQEYSPEVTCESSSSIALYESDKYSIVARTTSLRHRPVYQGFSGGIECVGLAFGPLIAGAIANGSSWRSAFWITVPTAGLSAIGLLAFVPNIPPVDNGTNSHSPPSQIGERLQQLDWPGMLCFVPTCVCLTLSLSWGGIAYPWSDSRVVALLALTVVMTLAFGIIESRQGDKAMFPVAFLRQRSVILGAISQLGISGSLFVFGFYVCSISDDEECNDLQNRSFPYIFKPFEILRRKGLL